MTQHANLDLNSAERARHALRVYLHQYGEDLGKLLSTLRATQTGVALDELHLRHGVGLPVDNVVRLVDRIIQALENLPPQFRIDDGAFRPPYRNAAIRLEAEWHLDTLRGLVARLSTTTPGESV